MTEEDDRNRWAKMEKKAYKLPSYRRSVPTDDWFLSSCNIYYKLVSTEYDAI